MATFVIDKIRVGLRLGVGITTFVINAIRVRLRLRVKLRLGQQH